MDNINTIYEECPICFESEILHKLSCNHSFCDSCYTYLNKCALCRKPIKKLIIYISIKTDYSNEQYDVYYTKFDELDFIDESKIPIIYKELMIFINNKMLDMIIEKENYNYSVAYDSHNGFIISKK